MLRACIVSLATVALAASVASAQPRELADAGADARSAADAYRDASAAFARGDAARYQDAFAPMLSCFYGRRDVPRAHALTARRRLLAANARSFAAAHGETDYRATRIHSVVIRVESETADQVVLHDWGWTGRSGSDTGVVFHRKRVVLARVDGAWRIVAEAPLGSACGEGPASADPPRLWESMRSAYGDLVRTCRGVGLGGSIGCSCETSVEATSFCESWLCSNGALCDGEAVARCAETIQPETSFFCFLDES